MCACPFVLFLCVCPFVLFCFCGFSFLFNLCVIKLSTLQSRVQPSTNEPDFIFADIFCTLNKHKIDNGGKRTVNSKVRSSGWCDRSYTLPVTTIMVSLVIILPVATGCVLLSVLTLSSTLPVGSWCLWPSVPPHFQLLQGVAASIVLAISSTLLFCLLQGVSSSKILAFSFAIRLVVKNHRHHLALVVFVLTKPM